MTASGASNSTPNARDGKGAERECRTIDHHSNEYDCDHYEGALGRDLRPRQHKIKRRGAQRGERRPFFDCVDVP
jgi:hypothetical protein